MYSLKLCCLNLFCKSCKILYSTFKILYSMNLGSAHEVLYLERKPNSQQSKQSIFQNALYLGKESHIHHSPNSLFSRSLCSHANRMINIHLKLFCTFCTYTKIIIVDEKLYRIKPKKHLDIDKQLIFLDLHYTYERQMQT